MGNEATRISCWFCFGCALCLLKKLLAPAVLLLSFGLLFDALGGRKEGEGGDPQLNWAADHYSEFLIFASFLEYSKSTLAILFLLAFIVNNFLPRGGVPKLPLREILLILLGISLLNQT